MYFYRAYGLGICSEIELPELGCTHGQTDITLSLGHIGHHCDQVDVIQCVAATPNEAVLSWGRAGTFLIRNGNEIIVDPFPEADLRILRLMVLGAALGVLLHQRGYLVLHASAVAVAGRVAIFIGRKGWGKSTTAAALYSQGHQLIADDIIALSVKEGETPLVLPGFPQFKLWPDAAEAVGSDPEALPRLHPGFEKRAYRVAERVTATPLPLQCIYVLDGGPMLELKPVSSRDAFLEVTSHSYAPRFLGAAGVSSTFFQHCLHLVNTIPVYRLCRQNSLAALPDVARMVEAHIITYQALDRQPDC
jgi:hypothetical protein